MISVKLILSLVILFKYFTKLEKVNTLDTFSYLILFMAPLIIEFMVFLDLLKIILYSYFIGIFNLLQ